MGRSKRRGSIRTRKDGILEVRITVGYKANGAPIQRSAYADTRPEAERVLTELLAKHDNGTLTDPDKMTVAECLERYVSNKVNADEGTCYKIRCEFRPLTDHFGPKRRVQSLRPGDVRDAYTALSKADVSIRGQRRAAMHLRAALREAVQEGVVARNVAEGMKVSVPRMEREGQVVRAWSAKEVDLFLEAARGELTLKPTGGKKAQRERSSEHEQGKPELIRVPALDAKPVPLYPAFYLMLALGLRRGETFGLPWKAIDFEAGTLRVVQSFSPKGDGSTFVIKPVKTSNSRRTLYLSQDVLDLLKAHRANQEKLQELMGSAWQEHGLVLTTGTGKPVVPRNAYRAFKSIVKRLDVSSIRLHDLRHTYASLALQRGVPIEVVSERLGHARVDITYNIYRHLYEVERQAAALSLIDLLGRQEQPRVVN